MIKQNKILAVLMLPALSLMVGCTEKEEVHINSDHLSALQSAVKMEGTIKINQKYFEDDDFLIPSQLIKDDSYSVKNILTYTNKKDYTGMDYKIYKINKDQSLAYVESENMYDRDGHLFFNTIDYNNVITNEDYALENGIPVPYGSNVSLNPFTFLKVSDFHHVKDLTFTLDKVKSALVFSNLSFYNMDVPININMKSNEFNFDESGLKSLKLMSNDYKSVTTVAQTNVYVMTNYELDFTCKEIGTANAKEEIKVEEAKPENKPLATAINNLKNATSFRVNRHYMTDVAENEETIDLYYSGKDKAIYMAPYDLNEGPRPTQPTAADALLVDSKKKPNDLLDAYMYQPLASNASQNAWQHTGLLAAIDDEFAYEALLLPLEGISSDVFDKNEDGSYSPIIENLKYMADDCFVPILCTTNEIAGDMVTAFKIFLTEDEQNLDRIELKTQLNDMKADIVITYDMLNECEIPFNALANIVE